MLDYVGISMSVLGYVIECSSPSDVCCVAGKDRTCTTFLPPCMYVCQYNISATHSDITIVVYLAKRCNTVYIHLICVYSQSLHIAYLAYQSVASYLLRLWCPWVRASKRRMPTDA